MNIADESVIFQDRADAGRRIAAHLTRYRGQDPIVLALPRAGVVVAYEIARALQAPLDILVVRKLGAPGHEEFGIGAIAPGGVLIVDDQAVQWLGISGEQLRQIAARETGELKRRLQLYRGNRPLPDIKGRTAILVDDGLATGVTARAAIASLRQQKPRRLVFAVPVCASETAERLRPEVDELVCASVPPSFRAVGLWYRNFAQTTDQEVLDLLDRAARNSSAGLTAKPG